MSRRQVMSWLLVIVALLFTVSVGHAAPSCKDDPRAQIPTTSPKYQVELDEFNTWQGPGGAIMFTVIGLDPQKTSSVAVCLRPFDAGTPWSSSALLEAVRVPQVDGRTGSRFAVSLPWSFRLIPFYGWSFYPPAELRVVVSETTTVKADLDVVRQIRVSPLWFAALAAAVFVGVVTSALYSFAKFLGVPGTGVMLRIISSASGWASLAQFQIILWTLVIGAGAVYVMTLRGSLIEISAGTLGLLGIAGAAAVASQVKNNQESQAPAATVLPGPIGSLNPEVIDAREATLSWPPPSAGGLPRAYTVQYRPAGVGNWLTVTNTVSTPRFRLVGLQPATAYDVQVYGTNGAGSGPVVALAAPVTTAPAPPLMPGIPPEVTGLAPEGHPTAESIGLRWNPEPTATGYTVEHRVHDGDGAWQTAGTGLTRTSTIVDGLRASTVYDFRVIATNGNGAGPPSDPLRATSGLRKPRWSDIVTNTDRPAEIDVARVQMLFFTVISAFFVAQGIAFSGTIPVIPASYVTLMGISNGVYLTSRFAGR